MKKILLILLLVVLAGCSLNSDNIELKSKDDVIKYVNKHYGKAELTGEEKVSDNNMFYYFKDEQYGFEYYYSTAVSGMEPFSGSGALYYEEISHSNFAYQYRDYIINNISINENDVKGYGDFLNVNNMFITLYCDDDKIDNAKNVQEQIKKLDSRNFFKDYTVVACNRKNQEIGRYNIGKGNYEDFADYNLEHIKYQINLTVNKNTSNSKGVKVLNHEKVQFKDVENLNMQWVNNRNPLLDENDWTTKYYFTFQGEKYFILADEVSIFNSKGEFDKIKEGSFVGNYTSYWFK